MTSMVNAKPSRFQSVAFLLALVGKDAVPGDDGPYQNESSAVQAAVSERRLAGMFVSYIATSPEKEGIARAGLLAEFAKLRTITQTQPR